VSFEPVKKCGSRVRRYTYNWHGQSAIDFSIIAGTLIADEMAFLVSEVSIVNKAVKVTISQLSCTAKRRYVSSIEDARNYDATHYKWPAEICFE
jgi:hypothetical protein